jgi:dienelactone hydrolase
MKAKLKLCRDRRKLTHSLQENRVLMPMGHAALYPKASIAFCRSHRMVVPSPIRETRTPFSSVAFRCKALVWSVLSLVGLACTPSRFLAHQMMRAPNAYPEWVAPDALVTFALPETMVHGVPVRSFDVGPPDAHLSYRVIQPADYQLLETHTTSQKKGKTHYQFRFRGVPPSQAKPVEGPIRGTLLMLHGYSVEAETMLPWAFYLGQDGWRSVVPDLRGHGRSTGGKVYFGAVEANDLRQLIDELDRERVLTPPLVVMGTSFGSALALKLAAEDQRVAGVVAITPYARLDTAILGIRDNYASWVPESWVRNAARHLPELTGVAPGQLDPIQWIENRPIRACLIAGTGDTISPIREVRELESTLGTNTAYFQITNGIHETIPLQVEELAPTVRQWLQSVR